MTSAGAMPPSPPDRSVSRDSQDSMEDYWSEVRNIEEDCQGGQEEVMEKGSIDGECRPRYMNNHLAKILSCISYFCGFRHWVLI